MEIIKYSVILALPILALFISKSYSAFVTRYLKEQRGIMHFFAI